MTSNTVKRKRCKNGTRKNKKTGLCEPYHKSKSTIRDKKQENIRKTIKKQRVPKLRKRADINAIDPSIDMNKLDASTNHQKKILDNLLKYQAEKKLHMMQPPGMPMQPPGMPMQPPGMPMQPPGMPMQPPGMSMQPPGMPMQPQGMLKQQPPPPLEGPKIPKLPIRINSKSKPIPPSVKFPKQIKF